MKNTLRLIAFGFFLLTQMTAFAQQQKNKPVNPEAKAKRQTAEMKVRLNLSDDQTAKVYNVLLSREKEMAEKKDQVRQKNQTYQSKIQSILNNEQQAEFKKMQAEKREQSKVRRQMQSKPQKAPDSPKNQ